MFASVCPPTQPGASCRVIGSFSVGLPADHGGATLFPDEPTLPASASGGESAEATGNRCLRLVSKDASSAAALSGRS